MEIFQYDFMQKAFIVGLLLAVIRSMAAGFDNECETVRENVLRLHILANSDSEEDQALFRQLMAGTRKIKQDTIVHRPQRKKISEVPVKRLIQEQADASHYFSDEFQPLLNTEGPVKYVRPDVSHFEAKKLRRGDYSPELFLDLHGLTQLQAKQELGALIAACRREHVFCACVMHGHGKHILKQQTPLWLAQHPHVMAFHQAPKEYGGDAALLVLIEVEEWLPPELP